MSKPEAERIRRHIENLASPDEGVSARAEGNLLRHYGVRALEQLIPACDHPNPVVRFRAVWVLGYTKDPRAFETILRLTDDPDERVRYDATIALGIHGEERAIPHLYWILLANDVTRPASTALARMGLSSMPALHKALKNRDYEIRHMAVNVVGGFAEQFGDAECIGILREFCKDPNECVRSDAGYWLEEMGACSRRGAS
jgi:HEAT repeat protein